MPQINQMISKKTLLKEFTCEIEKLKSELIATRQRNGVYLSHESFEELTMENESRRVVNEEQAIKIEALEINLRNKVQELFSLTTSFMSMKKENEATKTLLDQTNCVLEQTEIVLATTQRNLDEETILRKAYQETEEKLNIVGGELITTLGRTVDDIGQLRKKIRRKSDLQSFNRNTWGVSQAQVSEVTTFVESRVEEFQSQQEELLSQISTRMQNFTRDELEQLAVTQTLIQEKVVAFNMTEDEVSNQASTAKDEMDIVLEEIKTLEEEVKGKVGHGLQGLSSAAERISAEVLRELDAFHTQVRLPCTA
jgi:kinesin family protein 11